MKALDRYFFGEVALVRVWLITRGVLALLAIDTWVLMIARGARYGAGGFNVAHFAWLDAIAPVPSPAAYVGLELAIGLLALVLALTGANRLGVLALAALYTYGWAVSQLDSYQHHYLLSWWLVAFALMPRVTASELTASTAAQPPKRQRAGSGDALSPARAPAWAWVLWSVTCAVVYGFTALSKTEPGWRDGTTLRSMTEPAAPFAPLEHAFGSLGVSSAGFWQVLGVSVILLQVAIAVGYLVAARRDAAGRRLYRVLASVALVLALSFHLSAEHIELRIGWFSWYMMLGAWVALAPARWLLAVASLASWPGRALERGFATPPPSARAGTRDGRDGPWVTVLLAAGVCLVLGVVGASLELPGAATSALIFGGALAVGAGYASLRGRGDDARRWLAVAAVSALAMWAAVALSDARYDFYRYRGGDLRLRGDLAGAIDAYEHADRFAPEGKSRRARIEALRRQLGR